MGVPVFVCAGSAGIRQRVERVEETGRGGLSFCQNRFEAR